MKCERIFGRRLAPDGTLVAENFTRWFAGSMILGQDGSPLVVYHGTDKTVDKFEATAPTDIYELDGQEIIKANSWDMGDDRQGFAHGYHYGAISDAITLGANAAWGYRDEQARRLEFVCADTRRHIADLARMFDHRLTHRVESRPSGAGHFFSPDLQYPFIRDIGRWEGGNVNPVYLAIRNPIWLDASQIEGAGASFNIAKYRAQGFDGAIFADHPKELRRRGCNGSTQIVAFDARQVKSAIGNSGMFSREHADTADAWAWTEFTETERVERERMTA